MVETSGSGLLSHAFRSSASRRGVPKPPTAAAALVATLLITVIVATIREWRVMDFFSLSPHIPPRLVCFSFFMFEFEDSSTSTAEYSFVFLNFDNHSTITACEGSAAPHCGSRVIVLVSDLLVL